MFNADQNTALFPYLAGAKGIAFLLAVKKWLKTQMSKRIDPLIEMVTLVIAARSVLFGRWASTPS